MAVDLNNRHRDTLERIFSHPSSGNIEWRQVLSLLEAIGTTTEEHNGKVTVTLGPETEVLQPPRGKDIDEQTIVDLRRMLTQAGFAPGRG
ncbi:MAG TPA: type II toxin-antitoxin system HicA family toxin [Actinomycetes bacterium]